MKRAVGNIQLRASLALIERADSSISRRNSIPLVKNTGSKHWFAICGLAKRLFEDDVMVICEARFRSGGRADIFLPETGLVIEVLDSEHRENIEIKKAKYYSNLPVRVGWVRVDEVLQLGLSSAIELAMTRSELMNKGDD